MRIEFIIIFLGYLALLLVVSFLFSKRMRNLEDFFLASRRLPSSLVFLTLGASWLGATSTLVSVDEAYRIGVSSFWVMGMPALLTVFVFYFFLAKPIRQLPIVSLPDLVEMRYGRGVRHLAALLIIWYMILLAASQMVAVGNFLKAFLGTSYFYALLLGTAIVLFYSISGGFFSVVVTDGLQFFLLIAGLFGLLGFLLNTVKGTSVSLLAAELGREQYFSLFTDFKRNILILISFTLAWIISPIAWQRIQAAQTVKKAKNGLLAVGGTFVIVYGAIVLIGILALPLFPSGVQEGPILSALILSKTGNLLGLLLFIAIAAAIMSTMDTAINTGALSLTRDVFQQFIPTHRVNIIKLSRLSTVVIGLAAFFVATKLQSILKTIALASEILTEGLFIPGMAMLFIKKKRPAAGMLSLVLGGGYSFLGSLSELKVLSLSWWPDWPYSVPYGIGICAVGFAAGWIFDSFRER